MEFYNLSRQDLDQFVSRPDLTVAFHDDGDGVASAVLFSYVLGYRPKLYSPSVFGDYDQDVALDLGRPLTDNYQGLCIDHHDHDESPNYRLVKGYVPTGMLVYSLFKDRIPSTLVMDQLSTIHTLCISC